MLSLGARFWKMPHCNNLPDFLPLLTLNILLFILVADPLVYLLFSSFFFSSDLKRVLYIGRRFVTSMPLAFPFRFLPLLSSHLIYDIHGLPS